MGDLSIQDWHCYIRGDLNPQLNRFTFNDILADPSLASASEHPLGVLGEAVSRSIRPDLTRNLNAAAIVAVVLGSFVMEGQEALSYNTNVESNAQGAAVERIQMLYIRVPELTHLADPYCSDFPFDSCQQEVIVKMHPIVRVPARFSSPSLPPGSIVEIEFNQGFSRGIVKTILEATTSYNSSPQGTSAKEALGKGGEGKSLDGAINADGDPGNCPWSDGAMVLETQAKFKDPAYSGLNGTKMRNGFLEESGLLETDSASGARLVPPALEDFKELAAAFNKKFTDQTLKGESGYRTYASQVKQRERRITNTDLCGQGNKSSDGKSIGLAASPGTSNHGWGAAVDLNRTSWEHGKVMGKKAGTSKHFQWLNKFSKEFNFVFGAEGEHWHLDWMPFSNNVQGWDGMKQTVQTPWTSEGIGDESITLVDV